MSRPQTVNHCQLLPAPGRMSSQNGKDAQKHSSSVCRPGSKEELNFWSESFKGISNSNWNLAIASRSCVSCAVCMHTKPGSVVPRQRPPVCCGPRRPAVSSLGINEHTRRACDVPINAFPVSAARVWNSLPADVTSSPLLSTFKRRLKTELFVRSYP